MDISTLALYSACVSVIVATILYLVLAQWWASATGRAFMAILGSFSLLVVEVITSRWTDEYAFEDTLEVIVYFSIAAAMVSICVRIITEQLKNRKHRRPTLPRKKKERKK